MLQLAGCPVSNNPYIQVALTYIRRLFRRGNFLFLIFACPMLFLAANSRCVRDAAVANVHSVSRASIRQSCGGTICRRASPSYAELPSRSCRSCGSGDVHCHHCLAGHARATSGLFPDCRCRHRSVSFRSDALVARGGLATPGGGALMTIVGMGCPLLAVACVLVPPLRQEFIQFMSGQLELQAIVLICMGLLMILLGGMQLRSPRRRCAWGSILSARIECLGTTKSRLRSVGGPT